MYIKIKLIPVFFPLFWTYVSSSVVNKKKNLEIKALKHVLNFRLLAKVMLKSSYN